MACTLPTCQMPEPATNQKMDWHIKNPTKAPPGILTLWVLTSPLPPSASNFHGFSSGWRPMSEIVVSDNGHGVFITEDEDPTRCARFSFTRFDIRTFVCSTRVSFVLGSVYILDSASVGIQAVCFAPGRVFFRSLLM
jgi:hypothetical protein